MIRVTETLTLDEREITETFIRATGPGGQNVNKVASAVQLRFDLRQSPSLPEDVKRRAEALAGRRLTADGVLVITAQRYRSQDRNRADARERLAALLRRAAARRPVRRPTKPPTASRLKRRTDKARRATVKSLRNRPPTED